ncbi:hypothetical protein CEQ90_03015 [Lewinellaceae bacterium SD302]|nr:hypothetical protein CEQ90_03015 [Lewinellaceae bacterium SD302]
MMKRLLYLLFLIVLVGNCCPYLNAQDNLAIGEWQALQSFQQGIYVTQSTESIIYTTGRAVFYLDKEDLSITTLTRDDGLAETEIAILRYHEPTQTLIIIYENSVIDLLRDARFSTLRQIDNFNFSGGDNSINDVHFGEDNVIYLSAGYGISALNLDDETFQFTTFTDIGIESAAVYEGMLYAGTQEGIYTVDRNGGNIADFGSWELLDIGNGMPFDYSTTALNVWRDELYFAVNEDIWRWNNGAPELFFDNESRGYFLEFLARGPNNLLAGYNTLPGEDVRELVILDEDGLVRQLTQNCVRFPLYATQESNGRIWIGDGGNGIRLLPSTDAGECEILEYPGPRRDRNYRLEHDGESLWVATGTLTPNLSPVFNSEGMYRYKEGLWTEYNRDNSALAGRDGESGTFDDFQIAVGVAIDPANNLVWGGTYLEGAFSIDQETEEIELYDELNSTLQFAEGEAEGRVRVGNIDADEEGNVYFSNPLSMGGNPVHVRTAAGEWAALGGDCGQNEAFTLAVDDFGFIWALHGIAGGGGITIIDTKGTLLDTSDDECRSITANNSELINNEVRSIAVDLDGDIWVGTSTGITVFGCGSSAMDPSICQGNVIPVFDEFEQGGLLLETEDVQGITIDGANRKWMATTGGAYLLSPDGEEELLFFDSDNSPLLNNLVRDIAINPNDGTVFFGTDSGIISYRGDATSARRVNEETLKVFPNPVEPGYEGPIAIQGVARNANVKITDLSGKLVFETSALGGQVTWDGADYNGQRVQTGVYLVFATSDGTGRQALENPDTAIGKIVFIR